MNFLKDIVMCIATFALEIVKTYWLSDCPDREVGCQGCFTGPRSCQQSIVTTTQEPESQLGENIFVI